MLGSSGPASSVRQYTATLVLPPVRTLPSSRAPSLFSPQLASPPVSTLHNKARGGGRGGEEAGFFLSALAELTRLQRRGGRKHFNPEHLMQNFCGQHQTGVPAPGFPSPRDHPAPSPGMDRKTLPERSPPNPPEE